MDKLLQAGSARATVCAGAPALLLMGAQRARAGRRCRGAMPVVCDADAAGSCVLAIVVAVYNQRAIRGWASGLRRNTADTAFALVCLRVPISGLDQCRFRL